MRQTLLPLLGLGLALWALPRSASAQSWFEADYLFWGRANTSDRAYITGGLGSDEAGFDFASGYRLTLGSGLGDYEVEAIFSKIEGWNDASFGLLGLPLVFDDSVPNPILYPAGAATLAFNNGLYAAATGPLETSEGEFLTPGAFIATTVSSSLRDLQVNLGTNRDRHWFRWGIGYRNLRLTEAGGLQTAGTFDALDVDDGAGPASPVGNDPNDGLAHASLLAAGFTHVAGAADGFDSLNPLIPSADGLTALFAGRAVNRLDGVQVQGALRGSPNDVVAFEGFLRLGLFYNRIEGSYTEVVAGSRNDDSIYLRAFSDDRSRASFGVNPGVRALLNLTDYISLTAGYELLVLTGIALGPDQIGSIQTTLLGTTGYKVDTSGVFVGHGGNVGLEVRW